MGLRFSAIMLGVALLITCSAVAGCSGSSKKPSLPSEQPLLTGMITQKTGDRILIEADPTQPSGAPKCWLQVSSETLIYRDANGTPEKASAREIAAGQQVRAWSSGPVRESYPCQGTAGTILILKAKASP